MRSPLLALLALAIAATAHAAAEKPDRKANPAKPSATTKKKVKPEVVEPEAAEPLKLVPDSIDAATQIAMEAAKAAQAEFERLSAIGTDKVASPSNAKLAEVVVVAGVAAGKELQKARKDNATAKDSAGKPDAKAKPDAKDSGAKEPKTTPESKPESKPGAKPEVKAKPDAKGPDVPPAAVGL